MRPSKKIRVTFLFAVILLSAIPILYRPAFADPVSEISVEVSANVLRAGSNNTVTMRIKGISKLLSNLDVYLNLQQPLVLFGDNHWRRRSFGPGDSITATLTIFAPISTADNSYQATLNAVYKEAGQTSYSTGETHTISFYVRGWIDILIYDLTVDPSPAGPGSTVTVSGSLLNRGVTSALFTNLTIKSEKPLIVTSEGTSYLGQVDPNAPAPFSVSAQIDPTTPDGKYDITLVVYYQDDLRASQQTEISVPMDVSSTAIQTQTTTVPKGPISYIVDYSQYLLGLVVLIIVILVARRIRRRRSHSSTA